MRRLFIAAVLILFGCEAGLAQTTTIPGIGLTSPLGIPGATSSASGLPTGIPLGATEINPGGLGLAPIGPTTPTANCLGTGTGSSYTGMIGSASMGTMAAGAVSGATTGGAVTGTSNTGEAAAGGTTSSFDGGGMGSASVSGGCPLPSSAVVSSAGTASPMPGTIGTTRLDGGVIPLGSTATSSAGLSPLIGVTAPSTAVSPCIGSSTTFGSTTTSPLTPGSPSSSSLTMGSSGTSTSGC
jgi:hypothetical protein